MVVPSASASPPSAVVPRVAGEEPSVGMGDQDSVVVGVSVVAVI